MRGPLSHLTDDELFRRLVTDQTDVEALAEAAARWFQRCVEGTLGP